MNQDPYFNEDEAHRIIMRDEYAKCRCEMERQRLIHKVPDGTIYECERCNRRHFVEDLTLDGKPAPEPITLDGLLAFGAASFGVGLIIGFITGVMV